MVEGSPGPDERKRNERRMRHAGYLAIMGVSSVSLCLLAAAFFSYRPVEAEDKFDICKYRVERIRNGTEVFPTNYKGVALTIDNKTIEEYMYWGPVHGMNDEYDRTSRQSFLTLTTEGTGSFTATMTMTGY
jgi:hypothetical protein